MRHSVFPIVTILLASGAIAHAQSVSPIKLACDGKYNEYASDVRDVELNGIYVEINSDRVRVVGAIGFEGTYPISRKNEQLIIFTGAGKTGNLNRLDGHLTLSEAEPSPSTRLQRFFAASCRIATPLF